jgi:hypothetical protein
MEVVEGSFHPAVNPDDRSPNVAKYRAALAKQLLTPAWDAASVAWKQNALDRGKYKYTGLKPDRLKYAIADDLAFLAAHPCVSHRSAKDDGAGSGRAPSSRKAHSTGTGPRLLNELGQIELSTMPKSEPVTGPMRTQPVEPAANVATPVLPLMPAGGKLKKPPPSKQKLTTRTDAVRVAKAKIMRRNSLRKQREALRG